MGWNLLSTRGCIMISSLITDQTVEWNIIVGSYRDQYRQSHTGQSTGLQLQQTQGSDNGA